MAYLKNKGVLENNELIRHNFSLNASSKINNYLTVSASGNYSNNASRQNSTGKPVGQPIIPGMVHTKELIISVACNGKILQQVTKLI
jgi:hypothetical protein